MNIYSIQVNAELTRWEQELLKPPGFVERTSKKLSVKVNNLIPAKVHAAITASVRGIVKSALAGAEFLPKGEVAVGLTLKERDESARQLISKYAKIAGAEGAGTGAGGIVLGLVDFPALIAIHMKFLFELAHNYGYRTSRYTERLFLLHLFQLAFSGQAHKQHIFNVIKHWDDSPVSLEPGGDPLQSIDWEKLQQEYRDAIDFRKMLQMIPGIGAVVGAWANYGLQQELGITGMNAYRMRILKRNQQFLE